MLFCQLIVVLEAFRARIKSGTADPPGQPGHSPSVHQQHHHSFRVPFLGPGLISGHLDMSGIPCTDYRWGDRSPMKTEVPTGTMSQRMSQLLLPLGRGRWG